MSRARVVEPQPHDGLREQVVGRSSAPGGLVLDDNYIEAATLATRLWFADNGVERRRRPGYCRPIATTRVSDD